MLLFVVLAFSVQSNLSRTSNFFSSGAREIFVNELPFVREIRIQVGTNSEAGTIEILKKNLVSSQI